jgi:hypothetical protein
MWQKCVDILIVVKIVAKKKPSCKCYTNGQRINMYMLRVYIIHGAFDDIMLSHDLQLHVGCNFIHATMAYFIVNVEIATSIFNY